MSTEKLDRLLASARDFDASDLHLVAGVPAAFRVNGEIIIADEDVLSETEVTEIAARLLPADKGNTTSFPTTPDVLIISRRHHILNPDQLTNSYKSAAGKTHAVTSFAGFELYVRDAAE